MRTIHFYTHNQEDEDDIRDIRGIANGDRESFRKLYNRYEGLLFSTIFQVLHNQEDTEEVLQEVSVSLWRKANQYHEKKGRPGTWLTSMARNRAIDRLRSKKRRARLSDEWAEEQTANPQAARTLTGGEAAIRRDTCRSVRGAVLKLTKVQREAIMMAYFEGLTQQEIAAALGEPVGTVKARIRRGLCKLRESFDRV